MLLLKGRGSRLANAVSLPDCSSVWRRQRRAAKPVTPVKWSSRRVTLPVMAPIWRAKGYKAFRDLIHETKVVPGVGHDPTRTLRAPRVLSACCMPIPSIPAKSARQDSHLHATLAGWAIGFKPMRSTFHARAGKWPPCRNLHPVSLAENECSYSIEDRGKVVSVAGIAPARPCGLCLLRTARLLLRHTDKLVPETGVEPACLRGGF